MKRHQARLIVQLGFGGESKVYSRPLNSVPAALEQIIVENLKMSEHDVKPISYVQERRIINYVDEQSLEISRAYQKRSIFRS
jgi:hypothetical protein